jgi:hypothetical protein
MILEDGMVKAMVTVVRDLGKLGFDKYDISVNSLTEGIVCCAASGVNVILISRPDVIDNTRENPSLPFKNETRL